MPDTTREELRKRIDDIVERLAKKVDSINYQSIPYNKKVRQQAKDELTQLFADFCGQVIEAGRVDGMFIEWNGLNLADIKDMRKYVARLTGKEMNQ